MEHEKDGKRLFIFIALALILGWGLFSVIPVKGFTYGDTSSTMVLVAAMFSPATASLLTRFITKEGFKNMYLRPSFKGHFKEYLLIYFGPTFLLLLSGAIYFLIFPGSFDKNLTFVNHGSNISALNLLAIGILQVAIIGPVINIIPTLGEELGWRGYLLPKLQIFYPDRTALVICGAIWGIWHLPVIVMGHNYGKDYPGYPFTGILAMVIFCIVLGIIEGYAAIKLKSVIPAAMIHSTVNAGAALPIIVSKEGFNTLIGPAITGLLGGLPFIATAVILFSKAKDLRKDVGC